MLYSKGHRETLNGVVYEATANTMALPGSSSIWKEVGKEDDKKETPSAESANPYSKVKVYSKGEEVSVNNKIYRARNNTVGTTPGIDEVWQDIKTIPVEKEETPTEAPKLKSTKLYSPKESATFRGEIYKPKVNTLGATIEKSPELWNKLTDTGGLKHGKDGEDGKDGIQGPIGPQGLQGPQGERGIQGQDGKPGSKGDKGDTGLQGPKGDRGPPGEVRDRWVLGSGGYRNKILTQGTGSSLIFSENKHSTGLKSLSGSGSVTVSDNGAGTLTITGSPNPSGHISEGNFSMNTPADGTYILVSSARYSFTINQLFNLVVSAGTPTISIKINGTDVTGLASLGVTTTPQNPTATAANVVNVGDRLTIVITGTAGSGNLEFTMKLTTN